MALEDLIGVDKFIGNLNPSWPVDDDFLDEGDNHLRGVKNVLKNTFPNLTAAVNKTAAQLNADTLTLSAMAAAAPNATVDFFGIPAGVKQITVLFAGVSLVQVLPIEIQIGNGGAFLNSGYSSGVWQGGSGDVLAISATGFIVAPAGNVAHQWSGSVVLNLMDAASNRWNSSGNLMRSDGAVPSSAGSVAMAAGRIDSVRVWCGGGLFDAGAVAIAYL